MRFFRFYFDLGRNVEVRLTLERLTFLAINVAVCAGASAVAGSKFETLAFAVKKFVAFNSGLTSFALAAYAVVDINITHFYLYGEI